MIRISYSSSNTLLSCEHKFWLDKVVKAPRDPDAVESDAFAFGKVYHQVLENTKHKAELYNESILLDAARDCQCHIDELPKVFACLSRYYPMHFKSKLDCIACEIEIGDGESFIGYVDAILVDRFGNWWICDLKTSGMLMASLFARLAQDSQLNIYAYYVGQICKITGLDPAKFAGCRYRVVTKPKAVFKVNESFDSYAKRVNCESYDFAVPASLLNPDIYVRQLGKLREKAETLTEETTVKNRSNCLAYNRPCEYWSRCHGGLTYTECSERAEMFTFTQDTMIDCTIVDEIAL